MVGAGALAGVRCLVMNLFLKGKLPAGFDYAGQYLLLTDKSFEGLYLIGGD